MSLKIVKIQASGPKPSQDQLDVADTPPSSDHSERSLTIEYTDEFLDSEGAARFLKISRKSLMNLTSNGKVPHYKLGRRNRYRLDELRQLLLAQRRGGQSWE